MITKKDIPLNLLKTIESFAQLHLDIIQFKKENDTFYSFYEKDDSSKNFFKIYLDGKKHIGNFRSGNYAYGWKPNNRDTSNFSLGQGNLKDLEIQFQEWVKLIKEINDTPSLHDDNFARKYAEFYYEELKVFDEDADISPFNPEQQDFIDLYLVSLQSAIENSNDQLNSETKEELISQIETIQKQLPYLTKNEVTKAISKVFGKLYVVSRSFAKEIVNEAKKQLVKKLFELGIEYGSKLLEFLNK